MRTQKTPVRDVYDGERIHKFVNSAVGYADFIKAWLCNNGTLVVSLDEKGNLAIWSVAATKSATEPVLRLEGVSDITLSPDPTRVAATFSQRSPVIYDLRTLARTELPVAAPKLQFTQDGAKVMVISPINESVGMLQLWDVQAAGLSSETFSIPWPVEIEVRTNALLVVDPDAHFLRALQ